MDQSHVPAPRRGEAAPARARGTAAELHVRRLSNLSDLARFSRERVRAYESDGIAIDDRPYATLRAKGTTLAMMEGFEVVGGIGVWRWSDGPVAYCHPAHTALARFETPDDVVEIGSLFVRRTYRTLGYSQILLNAAAMEVVRMRPRSLVALSVETEVPRYVRRFGFQVVGNAEPHPLSPTLRVAALYQSFSNFIEHLRQR